MIAVPLDALAGGRPHRQQPRIHPYTARRPPGRCDDDGRWVEVGECGLAHPRVLAAAGLPGYSGLALGMGLDRLLMLVKHIPDIRLLRSGDPRVTRQLLDLRRYQPVSTMPPITRDLSVAVSDRRRRRNSRRPGSRRSRRRHDLCRGGPSTIRHRLPAAARVRDRPPRRKPGQKNLLVRVVLRDLERPHKPGRQRPP